MHAPCISQGNSKITQGMFIRQTTNSKRDFVRVCPCGRGSPVSLQVALFTHAQEWSIKSTTFRVLRVKNGFRKIFPNQDRCFGGQCPKIWRGVKVSSQLLVDVFSSNMKVYFINI